MTAYRIRTLAALLTTDLADLAWLWERMGYAYKSDRLVQHLGLRRCLLELAEEAYDWQL